jgi:CheY-like chemotaxis protein
MAGLLGQWGCLVHTALDTHGALQAIDAMARPPDIVLADYHLESETGIAAIARIREAIDADIPCVLITADRTRSLKAEAEELGVTVLHKPVRPAALRSVLSLGTARRDAAE